LEARHSLIQSALKASIKAVTDARLNAVDEISTSIATELDALEDLVKAENAASENKKQ